MEQQSPAEFLPVAPVLWQSEILSCQHSMASEIPTGKRQSCLILSVIYYVQRWLAKVSGLPHHPSLENLQQKRQGTSRT